MTGEQLVGEMLRVRYGGAVALDGVSVTVPAGVVTGIIGPNGAGKSSLLRALYGSVPTYGGTVTLNGNDVTAWSARARARSGLALVPQGRQLFPRLSVRENLQVMANQMGVDPASVNAALDRFPVLRERSRHLAGVLSGGEQQMLAVTRALMLEPSVLLLDEVMTGLAPRIVDDLADTFRQLRDQGVAIVVADSSSFVAQLLVERAYILVRGRVTALESGSGILSAYQEAMGVRH